MDANDQHVSQLPITTTTAVSGQQSAPAPHPYLNPALPVHFPAHTHIAPGGEGGGMMPSGEGVGAYHTQGEGSGGRPPPPGALLHHHHQQTAQGPSPQPGYYNHGQPHVNPNAHEYPQQYQQHMHQNQFGGGAPFTEPPPHHAGNNMAAIAQYPLPQCSTSGMPGPGGPPHGQSQPGHAPSATVTPNSPPPAQGPPAVSQAPKPIRRRMRMITSCLECRRRKLKCNKSQPCTNCMKFTRECVYLGPKLDENSQAKLTQIKEKVGSLERQFERDVAQKSTTAQSDAQRIVADDIENEFDKERELEQTPMVALDLTYEDDAKDDDVLDLGIKIGKMRITERIGGLSRPRISEEISAGLRQQGSPNLSGSPQSQGRPPSGPPGGPPSMGGPPPMLNVENPTAPDFLKPTDAYLAPSSNYFMGLGESLPSVLPFLLERRQFDRLVQQYFEAVHPVARCVHRPSFEIEYENFWSEIQAGVEPHGSTQALVFAALFTAAVSMDEMLVRGELGNDKMGLVQLLKAGTETALCKANFLRTTRVATLQALIMYMIPLCREEVSRSHSVLVGAAVRMAECMGLHRDGEGYGLSPVETHVRRLVWHQLCFLDVRTCEAQGPKPTIRREDYDTKIPINCEDEEITSEGDHPQPTQGWTSALLMLIRFEINEMMRNVWTDRRKLEMHKITLMQVLTKMEHFRRRIFDKYEKFLEDNVPIQRYAKLVMTLLTARLHAMVLHPYFANTSNPLPQRLSEVLIVSGIEILEVAIDIGSNPVFSKWAWYLGAFQQYQIALLLATEIYYRPNNKMADRIWRCLDHVFEFQPGVPREAKGMLILQDIMGKTAWYRSLRGVRAPKSTAVAIPSPQAAPVKGDSAQPAQTPPPPQMPRQGMSPPQAQMGQQQLQMGPPGVPMMAGGPQGSGTARGPPPPEAAMVFAGVSNGEAIWSFPRMPESPENSSDGGGGANQHRMSMQQEGMMPGTTADFGDVEMINALFPYDPQTGMIQSFGMNSAPYAFES